MSSSLAELRARLPELTLRDEFRLRRRLDGVRGPGVPAALREESRRPRPGPPGGGRRSRP
jgi:hypothetical protein